MDAGMDASTKRPLLEDDSTSAQSAPQETRSMYSRSSNPENYALLQDDPRDQGLQQSPRPPGSSGTAAEGISAIGTGNDTVTRRERALPANSGGGVLQFFECDEDETSPSLPLPRVSASHVFTMSAQTQQQAEEQARPPHQEHNQRACETRRKSRTQPKLHTQSENACMIELKNMSEDAEQSTQLLTEAASSPSMQGDDRNCFICLVEGDKDNPLIPCCSTCFARTHIRCWRDWRNNQQRTALRSRLLGLRNAQANNMLRCTICKSGTAMVDGEENRLNWMNELMCAGEPGENSILGRLMALGNRRTDSDEDPDAQFEDLVDTPTCIALVSYLCIFIGVLLASCILIILQRFYAGDVVLCCIIGLYQISVLQLVILAVMRRRGAMLAAATGSQVGTNGAESNVREIAMTTV